MVLLQRMSTPLRVHPLIMVPHVVLVAHRALLILIIHVFLLLLPAPHVGVIGPISIDVLVRLLVNIASTIHSAIGWLRGRSGYLQLAPRI